LFAEGVLNPGNCVLNPNKLCASEAQRLSGEAPRTLFAEGVLNPNSCVLNPENCSAEPQQLTCYA
jgi:hypothetical protein